MPGNALENHVSTSRALSSDKQLRRKAIEQAKALRGEFLHELWQQLRGWLQRKAAVAQLRALDDAALKDIGLHRSGIEAAVDRGFTGPAPEPRGTFVEKPHLSRQRTGAADVNFLRVCGRPG